MAASLNGRRFVGQEPGALPVCLALARAGHSVVLVDTDPYDRARLADMLPRLLGPDAGHLTLTSSVPQDAYPFSSRSDAALCTDWTKAQGQGVLCYSPGVHAGGLIEQIGADPSGEMRAIAEALGARSISLPASSIPLSARLHAELGRALEETLLTCGTPDALDAACVEAGFAVGPFALQDRLGIDTLLADRQAVETRLGLTPLPLFARAVSEGRLGRKASVGWHRYPGQGGAVEDPLVEDMAEEEAHFAGWARRMVADADAAHAIAARMDQVVEALIAEGVVDRACLVEIAQIALGYSPRPAIRPNTTAASSPLPDR